MSDNLQHWFAYRYLAVDKVREGDSYCLPADNIAKPRYRRDERHLFTILRDSSFGAVIGWRVFGRDSDPPSYEAHRTLWKQDEDSQRVYDPAAEPKRFGQKNNSWPAPTMEYSSVVLDPDLIGPLHHRILALRPPLLAEVGGAGLDGTSYELILGSYMARSVIRWWENAPDEWRDVGEVVQEALGYLEGTISKSDGGGDIEKL